MFIDSHCHLNMKDFENDLDNVVSRALEDNVKILHTICTKSSDFPHIKAIAEKYMNVFASFGVHPHAAEQELKLSIEEICTNTNHPKVISIGETGLDYYYEYSNKIAQKELFVKHIQSASITQLPLIVHSRDAELDTIDLLTSEYKNSPFPGLIHCFTASKEFAKQALDIGMYISISGIVTFKTANDLRETIKYVPLDRLLIETDAPYLAPIPFRGKRNEPSFVRYVADELGNLLNKDLGLIAETTSQNFFNLFTKCKFTV
jgi:TatD DNase family protein